MTDSWSYSQYSSAVGCLARYKMCYIDRLTPTMQETDARLFGSALHSGINASLSKEDSRAVFEVYWDSYKDKPIKYDRYGWEELRDLGLNFLSKFERLHAKKHEPLSMEKRLYGEFKGLKLEGTPDYVGAYMGRRSIRDFKTSGYNYPVDKRAVSLQLNLYAFLSISQLGYEPETLGYTVFNKGTGSIQDLTWDFDRAKMEAMLGDMKSYCDKFSQEKEFPKNPNSCIMGKYRCDYFDKCWSDK